MRYTYAALTKASKRSGTGPALSALLLIALVLLSGCGREATAETAEVPSLLDEIRQRGVLRAGIRDDNPPHSFIDESGEWVGFDVDIANAIADLWDVELERVQVDELTRISFLDNGRIDLAVASMSQTRERAEAVDFSQTYFFSQQTFLVRTGEIETLDDLVGKRVGADRGSSAIGNWQDWLAAHDYPNDPEIVEFGDKNAAVDAVLQGAIAGWAEDYEILASYAANDPSLTVLSDPGGIGLKLDGIALRQNDSHLRLAVNLALQDLVRSGEYDRIYDRWFGPDSTTPVPRQGTIEVWPNG